MRFTSYQATPLPDVRDNDIPNWARDLVAVLGRNLQELQLSIGAIGYDLSLFQNEIMPLTAGEALPAGGLCYLSPAGTMLLSEATGEDRCTSLIAIATQSISEGSTGKFMLKGTFETAGLTTGDILYVSLDDGEWTNTRPTGSGQIVRVIGYALSATQLMFDPGKSWVENK